MLKYTMLAGAERGSAQYPAILGAICHFQDSECRERVGWPVLNQFDDVPIGVRGERIAGTRRSCMHSGICGHAPFR